MKIVLKQVQSLGAQDPRPITLSFSTSRTQTAPYDFKPKANEGVTVRRANASREKIRTCCERLFSVDAELRYTEATATQATRWLGRVGTQWDRFAPLL